MEIEFVERADAGQKWAAFALYPDKWNSVKITAAYVLQQEDPSVDNNLFYAMFQIFFLNNYNISGFG